MTFIMKNSRKLISKVVSSYENVYKEVLNCNSEVKIALQVGSQVYKPLVKKGDEVKHGDLIAEFTEENLKLHSSVSGVVKGIEDVTTIHGDKVKAIVIEACNENELDNVDSKKVSNKEETLNQLEMSGIIDNLSKQSIISIFRELKSNDQFIINLGDPFNTQRNISIIENNYEKIEKSLNAIKEIFKLKPIIYTYGYSNENLKSVNKLKQDLGIDIIQGKCPYNKDLEDTVVKLHDLHNENYKFISIETLVHIYNCVYENTAMTTQFITIIDKKNNKSYTTKALVGNSLKSLIEEELNINYEIKKAIKENVLTGQAIYTIDSPICKDYSTIVIFGESEVENYEEEPCIKCGKCYKVCPINLVPFKLDQHTRRGETKEFEMYGGNQCVSCALCSYVCPSKRKLMESIIANKANI